MSSQESHKRVSLPSTQSPSATKQYLEQMYIIAQLRTMSISLLRAQLGQALPVRTQILLTSNIPTTISPDLNYQAEYKLLTDILVSVPKIKNEKVCKFISSAECP